MKRCILILILITACITVIAQEPKQLLDKKKGAEPNSNVEMVQMFISNAFDTISICNNDSAISIFEKRIEVLNNYICDKNSSNLNYIISIILNFELLTKIESESDGDFIGKYKPTYSDLNNWKLWLKENGCNLCWYKDKNILFLKKETVFD